MAQTVSVVKASPRYWKYWGKANSRYDDQPNWHPLAYHSLDVAAVSIRLLDSQPRLLRKFANLSCVGEQGVRSWIGFFVALHDLGKFSSAFQSLNSGVFSALRGKVEPWNYDIRHDSLGYLLWLQTLGEAFARSNCDACRDERKGDLWLMVLDSWVASVTGHHGQPPKTADRPLQRYFTQQDQLAAVSYVEDVAAMFFENIPLVAPQAFEKWIERTTRFSWWLAGLTVLSDWLGSNQAHFRYCTDEMPLHDYWNDIALPAASRILQSNELTPAPIASNITIESLFQNITELTPLQHACQELDLRNEPQLFLLEDVTGTGKTEAAFILLSRLFMLGVAQGAYLALPTMATANAMYNRTARIYRHLFEPNTSPSLILAHGSRQLHDGFRDSLLSVSAGPGEYEEGEPDASAHCNAWLADNRKLSLLAQVGVGTIDQALLAVLTSRHQSLRLFGLLDKVLIVDEVHASDAYMHRLLQHLLTIHARAGGSAILLSATLPQKMRQELADAFTKGRDAPETTLTDSGYPLLTRIDSSESNEIRVPTRVGSRRRLGFDLLYADDAVFDWIVRCSAEGKCVAWIRNTVADAIEAYDELSKRVSKERVTLFHSRFAMGDRLAIEDDVVRSFGPESDSVARSGRIVIATQVIEQSLDLDFDEMVSDLAPIDLLLQRAGRLRRHRRNQDGGLLNRNGAKDQRGDPALTVYTPDPDEVRDKDWFPRIFRRAAPIYPDHGELWLTARILKDRGVIDIPAELRDCIETVFGDNATSKIPDSLMQRSNRADGERRANSSLASMNAIAIENGYRHEGEEWWDETYTPTRLGEPATTVRLARWDGSKLRPWCEADRYSWAMSEVKVPRKRLAAEAKDPASEIIRAVGIVKEKWGEALKHTLLIPLSPNATRDRWLGYGVSDSGRSVNVVYSCRYGLTVYEQGES